MSVTHTTPVETSPITVAHADALDAYLQEFNEKQKTNKQEVISCKRWIWCTFQKVGYHYYPEAATDPALADVAFLGNRHRHLFKFKISIEVFHGNRELEFFQVLSFCESLFTEGVFDVNGKSVEMIADDLYPHLHKKYPNRDIKIEVSEDGENGCVTEYNIQKSSWLR